MRRPDSTPCGRCVAQATAGPKRAAPAARGGCERTPRAMRRNHHTTTPARGGRPAANAPAAPRAHERAADAAKSLPPLPRPCPAPLHNHPAQHHRTSWGWLAAASQRGGRQATRPRGSPPRATDRRVGGGRRSGAGPGARGEQRLATPHPPPPHPHGTRVRAHAGGATATARSTERWGGGVPGGPPAQLPGGVLFGRAPRGHTPATASDGAVLEGGGGKAHDCVSSPPLVGCVGAAWG